MQSRRTGYIVLFSELASSRVMGVWYRYNVCDVQETRMQKPWDVDIQVYGDEAELLAGLRRGDHLACTCLLKRYAPRFLRLAQHLVSDPDEAEDIMQEAFIAACDHIEQFRERSSLGTWLHRIVVNTVLMHLRHATTQATSAPLAEAEVLADPAPSPEAAALGAETRASIDMALRALPMTLRSAFVLFELDGMPVKEAAAALGIMPSAFKVRVHRARQALRAALGDMTDSPVSADLPEATLARLADTLCMRRNAAISHESA
jgi:RNA polymerase sigma-70 factor (ECF subfamily)